MRQVDRVHAESPTPHAPHGPPHEPHLTSVTSLTASPDWFRPSSRSRPTWMEDSVRQCHQDSVTRPVHPCTHTCPPRRARPLQAARLRPGCRRAARTRGPREHVTTVWPCPWPLSARATPSP
jgi:hypothetical protein